MTSLVSEFIINPVLRTARRFSRNGVDDIIPPAAANKRVLGDRRHETVVKDIGEEVEGQVECKTERRITEGSISGGPFTSSPIESEDGLEDELEVLGIGRRPDSPVNNGHSLPLGLGYFRPSTNDVDDDVSSNPSFGVPRGLRTNSGGTSTSQSIVDARMSPAEGPSRRSTMDATHHRNSSLPEDDGMGPLRQQIIVIQAMDAPADEKARLMHMLLTRSYAKAQRSQIKDKQPATLPGRMISQERPTTPETLTSFIWQMNGAVDVPNPTEQHTFHLSPSDLARTYAPADPPELDEDGYACVMEESVPVLGCKHYKRNVKLQCSACEKWYTCRLCHDEAEDHVLNRKATKNMLCMLCGCAQRAGEFCVDCGDRTAWYYCGTCGVCMSMSVEHSHKCIERVSDCDCPICGEYMFTSPSPVVFMLCSHAIHKKCYDEHMKSSYKCPICSKSTVNMETQFRNLDRAIDGQPMPPQFQDTKAMVSCNDCYAKSAVKYHWLGLKCAICDSYNTAQLSILSDPAVEVPVIETRELEATPILDPTNGENPAIGGRSRRHSSHDLPPPNDRANRFSRYSRPQRISRSVSPVRGSGFFDPPPHVGSVETDDSADEDDLDFWGREGPRSVTSAENIDEMDEDEEEESSDDDSMMDDCEEDEGEEEEDEFALFGHR
ncbi:hypothetical protein HYFRA_00000679 [Hymenoscyphus fraxineus]|uniref:Zf-CHY-domain-containing protein n=1 Tax=Hymenoscyphus fraxineus TaxID=746836 RepID=A0A9N9L549_9HELO|nr:hypothetical protein HYFRA_00000679 [Hymenoscyphus fraxineus]